MKITHLSFILATAVVVSSASADDEAFPKIGTTYQITYPDRSAPFNVKILAHGLGEWFFVEYTGAEMKPGKAGEPPAPIQLKKMREWINFNQVAEAK
jgi:hypothetical protein